MPKTVSPDMRVNINGAVVECPPSVIYYRVGWGGWGRKDIIYTRLNDVIETIDDTSLLCAG